MLIKKEGGIFYVDKWAIDCDTAVTSVTLRDNTVGIGDFAFSSCSHLESITLPNSVTSIGKYAFYNCSSLTSITFQGTVVEWNAISKGPDWNYNVPATEVVCSDGTVKLK
ncbi:MAG: leucine-rich repeat domain-containing protein [Ruminococcaceae bacterium]|nr:leucine-rich repeat domain-containing protein [Oscillospiraceae bacterium]